MMLLFRSWLLVVPYFLLVLTLASASGPSISNLQVTLRGKKYDLQDVTTVQDVQTQLEKASGVPPSQQGKILFNGKRLESSSSENSILSTAGVSEGDQLNCVPPSGKKSKTKTAGSGAAGAGAGASAGSAGAAATAGAGAGAAAASNPMKDLLEQSGIDTSQLDDLMKGMGGGAGGGGEQPSMQESMEMMSSMMNSPIFQEYMNDQAKLEESRQMIINNPMLKSMMTGMPGMEEIINSPEAWREAMQAAASMYQNMDQNDLMQAMMGGAGAAGAGAGGMPPGLFDGMDMNSAATTRALDELSEGED